MYLVEIHGPKWPNFCRDYNQLFQAKGPTALYLKYKRVAKKGTLFYFKKLIKRLNIEEKINTFSKVPVKNETYSQ